MTIRKQFRAARAANEATSLEKDYRNLPVNENSIELLYSYARELIEGGDTQQARELLDNILRFKPEFGPAFLGLAEIFLVEGDLDAALEHGKRAARLLKRLGEPYCVLGKIHHARKDYPAAKREIEHGLSLDSNISWAYQLLGDINGKLARFGHAVAAYQAAVDRFPQDQNLRISLAQACFNLAQKKKDAEAFQRASEEFKQALRINKRSFEAYLGLGKVSLAEKNYSEALKAAIQARSLQQGNVDALELQARALYGNRQYLEALSAFSKLRRLQPEKASHAARLGYIHKDLNDLEQAKACFEAALKLNPGLNSVRLDFAEICLFTKDWQRAEAAYRALLSQWPDDARLHYQLSRTALGQGRTEDVCAFLATAIEMDPTFAKLARTSRIFAELRQLPTFIDVVGTPELWREQNRSVLRGKRRFHENIVIRDEISSYEEGDISRDRGYIVTQAIELLEANDSEAFSALVTFVGWIDIPRYLNAGADLRFIEHPATIILAFPNSIPSPGKLLGALSYNAFRTKFYLERFGPCDLSEIEELEKLNLERLCLEKQANTLALVDNGVELRSIESKVRQIKQALQNLGALKSREEALS